MPWLQLLLCHTQNGWDNCYVSPIIIVLNEYFSAQYKPSSCPTPKVKSMIISFIFLLHGKWKTPGSKKMSWFLVFNIRGTEINDILHSRICDELCECKRYKYKGRLWPGAESTQVPSGDKWTHSSLSPHVLSAEISAVTLWKTHKLSYLIFFLMFI